MIGCLKIFYPFITDINECASLVSGCSPNADCTDTEGNYKCTCKLGFAGDGTNCARKYAISRRMRSEC